MRNRETVVFQHKREQTHRHTQASTNHLLVQTKPKQPWTVDWHYRACKKHIHPHKGGKKPLRISHAICVYMYIYLYISGYSTKPQVMSICATLSGNWDVSHAREEKKPTNAYTFFARKLPKIGSGKKFFLSSCDLIYNNNCSFIHFTLLLLKKGGKET